MKRIAALCFALLLAAGIFLPLSGGRPAARPRQPAVSLSGNAGRDRQWDYSGSRKDLRIPGTDDKGIRAGGPIPLPNVTGQIPVSPLN